MPRPTSQQTTYMALCVITELDEVARRAAAAGQNAVALRDQLCALVADEGTISPDMLTRFSDRAERVGAEVRELEENIENLTFSEHAIELARRSLS